MNQLRTFIGSKDYDVSKAFYSALGFSIEYDDGDLCLLSLDDVSFYLQRYYQKEWCENTMMHVSVEDASAWYDKALSIIERRTYGSAKVSPPKHEAYGARVTYLWDPTGVLWHLAEWSAES